MGQNLEVLEEEAGFTTVKWTPPANTGFAPYILSYEGRYDVSVSAAFTESSSSTGWTQLPNYDLHWELEKEDLRTLNSPDVYVTIRAVTHVGKGTAASVH